MKKSEIYRLAQVAVIDCFSGIKAEQKIEILRELMSQENIWKLVEEKENTNEAI